MTIRGARSKGRARIVGVLNQKGGVGKTTTATNLAAALVAVGKTVLVVDLDPQGNATTGLGVSVNHHLMDQTIYGVLLGGASPQDIIRSTFLPGLDVLPATADLAGAEIELVPEEDREFRLKKALISVADEYEYIFIDCPPSLGLLTINALVASTPLIIPVQCEFYALEGLSRLLSTIKKVQSGLNPELFLQGVVLTMYDGRSLLNQQVAIDVRMRLKEKVFPCVIPRNIKIAEAASHGKPIILYDHRSAGAHAYIELARAFLEVEEAEMEAQTAIATLRKVR